MLVIYTGGTIGSMPREPDDPESPLVVVDWGEFRRRTSSLSPRLADGSINPRYIGFNVDACSLEPVDSSSIGPAHWIAIAEIIAESYSKYEGFVVLHGTDTMVYTASALSFMLQNLDRPVVLTGALIPHLTNPRNDALQNLLGALLIANPAATGIACVPEVAVYFDNKLLRGNRARKVHASGFDAFRSVNYPILAAAGERIVVDRRVIRQPVPGQSLVVRRHLEPRVAPVLFFPGIQDSPILEHILSDPSLRGLVLLTYGAGTAPAERRVLDAIAAAVRRGVVAIAVTQCGGGQTELERYEAGVRLLEAGVVSGGDMTPEAALTKLMVLLGDPELSPLDVAGLAARNLAGELSTSALVFPLRDSTGGRIDSRQPRSCLTSASYRGTSEPALPSGPIERAVLRLRGAEVDAGSGDTLRLRVTVAPYGAPGALGEGVSGLPSEHNLPCYGLEGMRFGVGEGPEATTPPDEGHRTGRWVCKGSAMSSIRQRQSRAEPRLELLDVTPPCRKLAGQRVAFIIELVEPNRGGQLTWQTAELAISVSDAWRGECG